MFRGSLPTKLPHASAAWQFQYNSRTQVRAWEMTRPQRRSISILETQRAGGIHRFTLHRPLSGGFSTWLRCGAFNLPRRTYSSCHTDAPPWRSAASIEVVGTAPDLATQTFPSPNNTFSRAANPDHMSNTKSKSTIPTSRTTHGRHPRSAPKDDEEVGHRITKEKVELFHHTDVRGFDEAFLEQFSSCKKAMQGVHVSAGNRRRFNRGMQHEMNTFCEEVGLATIPSRRRSRDKRRPDSVLVRNTRLGDPQRVAQSTPSTPPDVNTRDHKIVVATRCGEDLFHLEEHEEEKFMPNVWFTRDEIRTYGFRLRRGTTPLTLWIAKKAKI